MAYESDSYDYADLEDQDQTESQDRTEDPAEETQDLMYDDNELDAIRAEVAAVDEEMDRLNHLHQEVEKLVDFGNPSDPQQALFERVQADSKSVYVGNVDYGSTAEELEEHFYGCGPISRVTIQRDKYYGHPKGFAYIEFENKDSVEAALGLHESLFRGRQIKVVAKRTNTPGMSSSDRVLRGRGFLSTTRRPRGRGFRSNVQAWRGRGYGAAAYPPMGRGFRSNVRAWRGRGYGAATRPPVGGGFRSNFHSWRGRGFEATACPPIDRGSDVPTSGGEITHESDFPVGGGYAPVWGSARRSTRFNPY